MTEPVSVNVRLERADVDTLIARHGNASAGLRAAVAQHLGTTSGPERARSERATSHEQRLLDAAVLDEVSDPGVAAALDAVAGSPAQQMKDLSQEDWAAKGLAAGIAAGKVVIGRTECPVEPDVSGLTTADKVHRHRRKTLLRTDWVDGTKVQTWACECGHEMSDR